jgi:hypothetical protein
LWEEDNDSKAEDEEEEEGDDLEGCICERCTEDQDIAPLCCKMSPCLCARPEGIFIGFFSIIIIVQMVLMIFFTMFYILVRKFYFLPLFSF